MKLATIAVTLGAIAFGCAPQEEQPGDLGNGAFSYECVSRVDPACPDSDSTTPTAFPVLALGGTFSLTYTSSDSAYATATIVPVSPAFFQAEGTTYKAIRSGTPGFYALLPGQEVLDFTEVTVAPIATIDVSDTTDGTVFDDSNLHTYQAAAEGDFGTALAGTVRYEWSTSDPSILTLTAGQENPATSIQASYGRPGTATLSAKSGSTTGTLTVVVGGG